MKHNIVFAHNNDVLECQTLVAFDYLHKKLRNTSVMQNSAVWWSGDHCSQHTFPV